MRTYAFNTYHGEYLREEANQAAENKARQLGLPFVKFLSQIPDKTFEIYPINGFEQLKINS